MNIKQTIKIFIQGDLMVEKKFTEDKKAFKWFEERFNSYLNDFKKAGYKDIHSLSGSHHVLFNEKTMTATAISYTNIREIDLKDAEGNPIVLDKYYKGKVQIVDEANGREHDIYRFSECPFGHKEIYLRNISCWDTHVITVNGNVRMSRTVADVDEGHLTQEFIDKLNLKPEEK